MLRHVFRLAVLVTAAIGIAACEPEPSPYQALLTPAVRVAKVTVNGPGIPDRIDTALQKRLEAEFATNPNGSYPLNLEVSVTNYVKGTGTGSTALALGGQLDGRVQLVGPKTGQVAASGDLVVLRDNINGVTVEPLPGLPDDVLIDNFARAVRQILFGPQSPGILGVDG
jgi:hypothetical protein